MLALGLQPTCAKSFVAVAPLWGHKAHSVSPLSQPHSWCVPQVPCRRLHHDFQFKVSTSQTSARYASQCLTDSLKAGQGAGMGCGKASTVVFGNFYGIQMSLAVVNFQTTNFMALKVELGRDAPKGFSPGQFQTRPSMLGRTDLRCPPEGFPNSACVNKDKQLPALKCHCRFKDFPRSACHSSAHD